MKESDLTLIGILNNIIGKLKRKQKEEKMDKPRRQT